MAFKGVSCHILTRNSDFLCSGAFFSPLGYVLILSLRNIITFNYVVVFVRRLQGVMKI